MQNYNILEKTFFSLAQLELNCFKKRIINKASCTAQKINFSIKDFFSKCDQIRRKLRIWSHLLKKYLMKNFFVQCYIPVSQIVFSNFHIV